MDDLAQYAAAKISQHCDGAEVVMHNTRIPPDRGFWYHPCEFHDDFLPWLHQPADCRHSFLVVHNGLGAERLYLYGRCPRCGRVHVFLRSEIRE